MSDEQIIVRISHVRDCNLCVRGARQWFKSHGLDFNIFLTQGYPVEVIEATGDALGFMVAKVAREEADYERGAK